MKLKSKKEAQQDYLDYITGTRKFGKLDWFILASTIGFLTFALYTVLVGILG